MFKLLCLHLTNYIKITMLTSSKLHENYIIHLKIKDVMLFIHNPLLYAKMKKI